jgi:cell wall-associated NlpC family hydrolase
MLVHDKGNSTELASLGSGAHHGRTFTAFMVFLLATLMTTLGVSSWVAAANAAEPTREIETIVTTPETVGMPTEMKIRALTSMKNERVRQGRLNRVAEQKHEVRIVRTKIVKTAKAQIGDPYRAGHSGPNAFDCSGFVRYVYKQVTGKTLPHYSKAQYKQARKITKKDAQPGDLVFFFEKGAHHVGIYIGNGKMIDAPRTGERVRVSPITGSWWGRSYTGMGRVLPA